MSTCKDCKYFTTFNDPEWPGLCEYPVPYWMEEAGADPLITGSLRAELCNTFEAYIKPASKIRIKK
jgi:hypothetical protein